MRTSGSPETECSHPRMYLLPKLYIGIKLDYSMKLLRLKHGGAWQILIGKWPVDVTDEETMVIRQPPYLHLNLHFSRHWRHPPLLAYSMFIFQMGFGLARR